MAETLNEQVHNDVPAVSSELGKITILEALATESSGGVSPDSMGRTTMQMSVDFDD